MKSNLGGAFPVSFGLH